MTKHLPALRIFWTAPKVPSYIGKPFSAWQNIFTTTTENQSITFISRLTSYCVAVCITMTSFSHAKFWQVYFEGNIFLPTSTDQMRHSTSEMSQSKDMSISNTHGKNVFLCTSCFFSMFSANIEKLFLKWFASFFYLSEFCLCLGEKDEDFLSISILSLMPLHTFFKCLLCLSKYFF